MSNPCTDYLTDLEYLKHMIPHHQVAIDMSNMLIDSGINDPILLHLCRDIIRKQDYEIWEMNFFLKNISETIFSEQKGKVMSCKTMLDKYAPVLSKSKDGDCDPLFFKPDDHAKHMKHMKITPKSYLEHMIPHHQVAVDMSKRLLLHTYHSYLMDFAKKLIINQQGEIWYMNNLLMNKYTHESDLLNK